MIKTPKGADRVRPTQARLRQALFNSIQTLIPDARILDLFAGSGALGFEALSRGAAEVTFVEEARSVVRLLDENVASLAVADRVKVIADSVDRAANRVAEPFDIVLADPPYSAGWELKLLNEFPWNTLLRPEGVFCLEWGLLKSDIDTLPDETAILVKIREKNYGDSVLTTFQRKAD
jgi:16S rRNA (guanine966-N2)-methyltransferase